METHAMDSRLIESFIRERFATKVGLDSAEIFDADLTLAEVVMRSDKLNNSVDLMEAFASTANGLRKEHGVRVRLPAFPLDTRVSVVLDALAVQAKTQPAEGTDAA
jgi:hypothetical protein